MSDLGAVIRAELAPTPNRLARAALIAVLCGVVVLASKVLSLPETAISVYLVFFASKEEATLSVATATGLVIVAFVGLALGIMLIMLSSGTPMLRILVMFSIAFGSMYVAAATPAGVIVATLGMVFFEVLSLLDYVPFPDLVLRGLFWLLPIIIVPMAILVIGSLIFSRSAIDILSQTLSERLTLIGRTMVTPNATNIAACRAAFFEGGAGLTMLRRTAALTGRLNKEAQQKAARVQDVTTLLLGRCAGAMPPENTANNRGALKVPNGVSPDNQPEDALLQELLDVHLIEDIETGIEQNKNPQETMRFAVKATLAIAICYGILTILHWPAIHTITITAFLVSLGTTGETLHKAMLRLTGAVIGGVISFFCLLVIIPNLDNAAELAVLTMLVAFPAAWIAVGKETSAYLGMQIALVFFLSVLNTSGPNVDMGIAWGRVVGIILGNLVVAGVFLTLWPKNSTAAIERDLERAITAVDTALSQKAGQGIWLGVATDALQTAGAALRQIELGNEFGFATHERAKVLRQLHEELENLSVSVTVSQTPDPKVLTQLRDSLGRPVAPSVLASEGL